MHLQKERLKAYLPPSPINHLTPNKLAPSGIPNPLTLRGSGPPAAESIPNPLTLRGFRLHFLVSPPCAGHAPFSMKTSFHLEP